MNTQFRLCCLVICFAISIEKASAQSWQWARQNGVGYLDVFDFPINPSVATDPFGNVYILGTYGSSNISFGTDTLINPTTENMYLVKYDSTGNVKWARNFGSIIYTTAVYSYHNEAHSLAIDSLGNIYVTGYGADSIMYFGTIALHKNPLNIDIGMFIAKYDSGGHAIWAKCAGGREFVVGEAIYSDANSHVYVTGACAGTDTIEFDSIVLTGSNIFLTKYDSGGNAIWAKGAKGCGNLGSNVGWCVTENKYGDIFVAGTAQDSIKFGMSTLVIPGDTGIPHVFIVKYDSSGNFLWARGAGGNDGDEANSVVADTMGNAYVCGGFGSSSIAFGTTTLINGGAENSFFVKYSPAGSVLWAKSGYGPAYNKASALAIDDSNNIFMTGYFDGGVIFNTDTVLGNVDFANSAFVVKYDISGSPVWTKAVFDTGSGGGIYGTGIAVSRPGNVYIAGCFGGTISFGAVPLVNVHPDSSDVFLAKIDTMHPVKVPENAAATIKILIYPNPTRGEFTVELPDIDKDVIINIFNLSGNLIEKRQIYGRDGTQIDLNKYPCGEYIIHVDTDDAFYNEKIILK